MEPGESASLHKTTHCQKHGDRREAFVCDHLLHGAGRGFFAADDEPENPHPDAWCSECDQIRSSHSGPDGEWNEKSESLIKVKLVCGDCYEEIKARNILSVS